MKKHRLKIISCIVALGIIVTSFPVIAAVDDLPSHIGLWTFDDNVLTESVGRYVWNTPIVTSPDLYPITPGQTGVVGQAWRIQKRDHLDESAAGINLGAIPSALVGTKKFAISMWINPMKFESYQTA